MGVKRNPVGHFSVRASIPLDLPSLTNSRNTFQSHAAEPSAGFRRAEGTEGLWE
jgi:hypothetical protein